MYGSGNSKYLSLDKKYEYSNDGYDMNNPSNLPNNMTNGNAAKSVIAFRVAFGDENQSMFKNISITQEDFSETEESRKAQSELFDRKGATQRVFKGTDNYNIYSLRSYNVNFDMMGNAMIQPLMYLQLDNIPMFHGAYSVVNVSHDISPNTMNTKIKAVRKSKYSVPIVSNSTTFLPLDLNANLKISSNFDVANASNTNSSVLNQNVLNNFKNPLPNITITSPKGLRGNNQRQHQGVDLMASVNTPISASWGGIVNTRTDQKGYGLFAIIDHSNGSDKPFEDGFYYYTLYGHLNDISIQSGNKVNPGQSFAKTGGEVGNQNAGNSQGPHLHYEIRRTNKKLKNINEYFTLKGDSVLNPEDFFKQSKTDDSVSNGVPSHGELT
jgi:murein DD-endopeptidase MepM/ murein hydrolase activator NlpD